ncbi:unnamed protein product [Parajaminaea phylloscopi]
MAPGPSSEPTALHSGPAGEGLSAPHTTATPSSAGQSTVVVALPMPSEAPTAAPVGPNGPPQTLLTESRADTKQCSQCGALLDMTRDSVAAAADVTMVSHHRPVQSYHGDIPPPAAGVDVDMEDAPRLTCQSCHERQTQSAIRARQAARQAVLSERLPPMDLDLEPDPAAPPLPRQPTQSTTHRDRPASPPAASESDVDPHAPLSIAIGSSLLRQQQHAPASPSTSRTSSSSALRRESLTRSHPVVQPAVPNSSLPPMVRVPQISRQPQSMVSRPPQRDAEMSQPRVNNSRKATIDENHAGPSAMTRPRLSTLSASSHRSQSPSASRMLPNPLSSPFVSSRATMQRPRGETPRDDKSRQEDSPEPVWYQPARPDPMPEISQVRMPPCGRGCLYPGALFRGTQKSGSLSYDVTVEILNVDLPNSHLDGYLNILGLTEDWPEMTTYFTAEIIGREHRFVTDKWGATRSDDMKHWARFDPFEPLRSTAEQDCKFNHMSNRTNAVFMRWKERFLVPDWRVQDIHGASFAGFYYVCVEFGDMAEWETPADDTERQSRAGPSTDAAPSSVASVSERRTPSGSGLTRQTRTPYVAINPVVAAAIQSASSPTPASSSSSSPPAPPPRTRTPVSERRLGGGQYHSRMASLDARAALEDVPPTGTRRPLTPEMPDSIPPRYDDDGGSSDGGGDATATRMVDRAEIESIMDDMLLDGGADNSIPFVDADVNTYLRGPDGEPGHLRWLRHVEGLSTSTAPPASSLDRPTVRSTSDRRVPGAPSIRAGLTTRRGVRSGEEATQNHTGQASSQRQEAARPQSQPRGPAYSGGRITAFYYHANSEPYQQLDLRHVPQRSSSSFELR